MTNSQRLAVVRAIHTLIYIVMAGSVFAVLYAGVSGAQGAWMWVSLVLVGIEVAVFSISGMKCPLTSVAVKYGARTGDDTFFPQSITRHTLTFFGPLIAIGVLLLAARWSGVLG